MKHLANISLFESLNVVNAAGTRNVPAANRVELGINECEKILRRLKKLYTTSTNDMNSLGNMYAYSTYLSKAALRLAGDIKKLFEENNYA